MSPRLTLLLIDPDDVLGGEAPDFWVADAASYLGARRAIAKMLADPASPTLRIAIVGARMQAWFRDLRPLATLREPGLRARLARSWGRALPLGLSAGEIRTLGLEEINTETLGAPAESIGAAILAHALGPVWAKPTPSPSHLAALVLAEPTEATTPWLHGHLSDQLDVWERDGSVLTPAYRALRAAPHAFRDAVLIRAAALALSRPSTDELFATHAPSREIDAEAVRRAVQAVRGSALRNEALAQGRERLHPVLLRWWRGALNDAAGSLAAVAAHLPGDSAAEAEALADLAEGESGSVTRRHLHADDFSELYRKYGGFERNSEPLARLARFVLPEAPAPPDPLWAESVRLDVWKPWLNDYLPYRAAIDRLGASAEEYNALARGATAFSDWLTTQYDALVRDGDALVTNVHHVVRERVESGSRVLWVIWDNLPAHHAEALAEAFHGHDLTLASDIAWRVALLPSVTAVSFPALLAGRQTARTEGRDDAERSALLQATFGGHTVHFQNTLRHVEQIEAKGADISVVHFTDYDALLHKPEHALSDTREALLARERATISERLADAVRRFPRDRPITLVVTSDHGSTRLPTQVAQEVPLPGGVEPVESYSSRAVRVPVGTDSSGDVCHRLDPSVTGLEGPVLLARGFRSWSAPRAGSGYVHGGALPEEVLVPVMVLETEPAPVEALRLDLVLPDPLPIGTSTPVRLTLTNPNAAVALRVRVAILVGEAERGAAVLNSAPPDSANEIILPFTPFPTDVQDGSVRIRLALTATVLGQPTASTLDAILTVQSALRSRADTDLFDF